MKIYFDTLVDGESNLLELQSFENQHFWLVSLGTILKKSIQTLGYTLHRLKDLTEPGCYFVDANGDPKWWAGIATGNNVPTEHILSHLPKNLIELIKNKKLRLIIAADKEGGSMNDPDAFLSTTHAMLNLNLPKNSVLIIQGNAKIKEDYEQWLIYNNFPRMFEVQYSSHFTSMFLNNRYLPSEPAIYTSLKEATYDFNSLNRVYRPHRGAHCYTLVKKNLLTHGLVSCNQLPIADVVGANLVDTDKFEFLEILKSNYPRYLDGDWSEINAAEKYNFNFYKDSLISFVTETKFDEGVVFPTEKIYKPIAFGHPMILLASAGTLKFIKELGFRIDWCGIDPSYNDIIDHKKRFIETHKVLEWWINLSREEKNKRILDSEETIIHNFNLIRKQNFYHDSLKSAIESSEKYFND